MALQTSDDLTLAVDDAARRATSVAHASKQTRWWIAYPVALLLLGCLDAALSLWRPLPARLPEQFSPAYLGLYVSNAPRTSTIAFLGDSVLWGYKLPAEEGAISLLRHRYHGSYLLNASYEGGSTPNSAIMLRYLLKSGVRPKAVVVNVNVKEFNPNDSAYRTLHPSLERASLDELGERDRARLTLHEANDLNSRLNRFVESIWRLYRLRADIREALFGRDDMASAVTAFAGNLTGSERDRERADRPTPDRFLGTYDLSPISGSNVGMIYYKELISELCSERIPALFFLTPANHTLLHDYIDAPEYDANLATLMNVRHCSNVHIVNWDRAILSKDFIDNDHLTAKGQRVLAARLDPYMRSMLK